MAALNKRWVGSSSDTTYTTATNWAPISLVNSGYSWTASGSGTNEYYLRTSGGANPGISTPGAVYANGSALTSGSLGSLAAGRYGYGDNDTLGYSTIYVRLSDGADPDSKSLDYVQLYQIPVATDNVRIPAGSSAITGTDQSAVAIGDFIVEDGYTGSIGSATAPLYIDPDRFEFAGTGTAYIDIGTAAIAPDVRNAGTGQDGTAGLYLTGSGMTTLTVSQGTVGVALLHGQTATVATVRVNGDAAFVILGKGTSLTTGYLLAGKLTQRCASTTTSAFKGTLTTEENGAIGTLNIDGTATGILNSTGTISTLNLKSEKATADFSKSAEARAVTDFNWSDGTLLVDDSIVTFTNRPDWENGPKKLTMIPV